MARYDFEKSGEGEFTLEVDKQNLYVSCIVRNATKSQRPSDKTPEFHFKGHNGNFRLIKTYKYDESTFTTPYVLVVEGGAATVESGIPEEFAKEIVRKITEEYGL